MKSQNSDRRLPNPRDPRARADVRIKKLRRLANKLGVPFRVGRPPKLNSLN